MIDLAQNQASASFITKCLKRLGMQDIGSAIAALAYTIKDHKHLERVLTDCSGEERQMIYDTIVPHLRFTAKPLDVYVANVGQRAEREQWPVMLEGQLREFRPATDVSSIEKEAEKLIAADLAKRTLTMTCSKCLKQEKFHQIGAETNVDVIIKARQAGWIHDYLSNPAREICPKCPSSLRTNG